MDEYVFENIKRLETPVGYFSITDGEKEMPFSVVKNSFNIPAQIYDENGKETGKELSTETNYSIVIDIKNLDFNHIYRIFFSEISLEYFGSDAETESQIATFGEWSIGLGIYNPNAKEETEQFLYYIDYTKEKFPEKEFECDKSKFKEYEVWHDEKGGYDFKLLDKSKEKIYFNVAWIKNENYPKIEYESAIDFWVS